MTDLLMSMAVFLREPYALNIVLVFHSRVSKTVSFFVNLRSGLIHPSRKKTVGYN